MMMMVMVIKGMFDVCGGFGFSNALQLLFVVQDIWPRMDRNRETKLM